MKVRPTQGDSNWFVKDRFGMFIHWGLYALPARHEWVKHNEKIPDSKYDVYFKHFNPDLYDPQLWARAAANAGMKYFVVTTKHHEGFCLWDSKLTDYKAPCTPAKRDLLHPMVDAFRQQGLRTGFYHSLIDWHHPDFIIDHLHPMRRHPEREKMNRKRRQARYAEYLHGQVRELLTQFGKIDIIWLDFSYPERGNWVGKGKGWQGKGRKDWQSEKLYRLIRKLAPNILLNDRLDLDKNWDFKTPEQRQPPGWVTVNGQPVVWEQCQTFSGSWGYHRDESSWMSVEQLVRMLIDAVSKGGNMLLNVGPTGRGEFDERALARLCGIGEWMRRHNRSIYGCSRAPTKFKAHPDCRLTHNPETKRLYLHVFGWTFRHVCVEGLAGKIAYAQLLNDASEVPFHALEPWQKDVIPRPKARDTITFELPIQKPDVAVPVIEIFLK